jgi:hypothetical protein
MPKAVVLFDLVAWNEGEGEARVRHEGEKGKEYDIPQEEFNRLKELGAVASPSSKDAKAAASDAEEQPEG